VRFVEAVTEAAAGADLVVEAGPGRVLSALIRQTVPVPVVSMDCDGPSLAGLLRAVAAAYVLGAPVRHAALFADRHVKPLPSPIRLFANPCDDGAPDEPDEELVPVPGAGSTPPEPAVPVAEAGPATVAEAERDG